MIGKYKNGNYTITILNDGTKIRYTKDDEFHPQHPESFDCKICNKCDMGCAFCHENSTPNGRCGDIINAGFIGTLQPYSEIAIGGGNPLEHPQLEEFLIKLKNKKVIASMTVNQEHLFQSKDYIQYLIDNKLIYGLGVSLTQVTDELTDFINKNRNTVLHIINGIVSQDELKKLFDKNIKILILGYKEFRRGKDYYSSIVENHKSEMCENIEDIIKHFDVVSFDNLALKQLDIQRIMPKSDWDEFYMGDDGGFTMYVDLVENQFARSSTSIKRYPLKNSIEEMFNIIRSE